MGKILNIAIIKILVWTKAVVDTRKLDVNNRNELQK